MLDRKFILENVEAVKLNCQNRNVPADVVYSDSQYVVKTMTENWNRNKNLELWSELDNLAAFHKLHFHGVRGHRGDPFNERCDAMAKVEIAKLIERKLDHPKGNATASAG